MLFHCLTIIVIQILFTNFFQRITQCSQNSNGTLPLIIEPNVTQERKNKID